jgi:hypothetical protein
MSPWWALVTTVVGGIAIAALVLWVQHEINKGP